VLVLALALAGCEKGCLATWFRDHGVGGSGPGGSGGEAPRFDLGGTDCSDGLARCVGGRVEISRAAHLPHPCTTREGKACTCPWEPGPTCATGCASEGTEIVASVELATLQLCRPDAPVVRPYLPGDPPVSGVCDAAGFTCIDGVLRACEAATKSIAAAGVCLHGCEPRVGLPSDHGDPTTLDGAAAILCARLHAERR